MKRLSTEPVFNNLLTDHSLPGDLKIVERFPKVIKRKRQYEEMVSENILFTEQNANYKNENEQFDHYKEDFDNLTK